MKIVFKQYSFNLKNTIEMNSIFINVTKSYLFKKYSFKNQLPSKSSNPKITNEKVSSKSVNKQVKIKKIEENVKDTIENENSILGNENIDYYNEKYNNIKLNKINKLSSKPVYISPNITNLNNQNNFSNKPEFEVKFIDEININEKKSKSNVSSSGTSGRLGFRGGSGVDKNNVLNKAFGNQRTVKLDYDLIKENLIRKNLLNNNSNEQDNIDENKNENENEKVKVKDIENVIKLDDKHEAVIENKKSFNDHFSDSCKMYFKAGDGGNGSVAFYKGGMLDQSKIKFILSDS